MNHQTMTMQHEAIQWSSLVGKPVNFKEPWALDQWILNFTR
jgi:hypothetical protein